MKKQGKKVVTAAPVEKNQEILLTIDDLGSKGEGIGRYEGFTVFVEGALPKEVVWVRIVQVRKNFAFGKLMKVMEPSGDRTEPVCFLAGKCGGCQLCHFAYEGQLRFKRDKVRQVLERIGHFSAEEVAEVLAENTLGMTEGDWLNYRNKAQFPIQIVDGQVQAGFMLLAVIGCFR
ncbi:MAG: class I SAM-dependent RNA methyltransferase [Firmicutes bacterium]|nr:class I SAM-dependent RNA methyltransferase [Bacillota bacterium]